jgi:hypothetical protein
VYRNDHDAALLRIEALEHENEMLVRQVATLREMRPYQVLPHEAPPVPTPTVTFPRVKRHAQRPAESDPSDWVAVAMAVCFMILFAIINVY